jgi:hypothetical protein
MSSHAGETGFHWALKEGGQAGGFGALVGAFLAWPHSSHQTIPLGSSGTTLTTWHNAFTHSVELSKVVEAGLAGGGLIAVGLGLFVGLLFPTLKGDR